MLNEIILKEAVATGLGWVTAGEIDEIGIGEALRLATRRAVQKVQKRHQPFSQIVIDGKVNFLKDTALEEFVSTMPKADDLIKEVSAASIIAKVARDNYMVKLAEKYPQYGFESHVGYGTAKHIAVISEFGICPEHRKSFEPIKSRVGFSRPKDVVKNTTKVGNRAEKKVAEYLALRGHKIIARNFKSKLYEIDIISICQNTIYFTEVKYRKSDLAGGGLVAIDKKKQDKMRFAVECFLKTKQEYKEYDPQLAVAAVTGDDFVIEDWFELI